MAAKHVAVSRRGSNNTVINARPLTEGQQYMYYIYTGFINCVVMSISCKSIPITELSRIQVNY